MRFFNAIKQNFVFYFLALLILGSGVAGFQVMGALKTPIEATPVEREIPLVQLETAAVYSQPIPIRSEGFVKPFRQVQVSAISGGQVVELNPAIEQLGKVRRGDILARLDDRAAKANLARTQADLNSNLANLALLQKQRQRSLQLVNKGALSQDALDQIETQITQIDAATESLKAAVASAQVALENTLITAPFDAQVLRQIAQLGTVLGAGQPLAELFTDRELEVDLSLTEKEASLIGNLFEKGAAKAQVVNQFGGQSNQFDGTVVRVSPQIDPTTRTLGVTVRVDQNTASSAAPLLPNAYVEVVIEGAASADIYQLPSNALRGESSVWLAMDETLSIEPIQVVHRDQALLYVRGTERLAQYDVIVSALDNAAEGMRIRFDNADVVSQR